MQNNLCFLLKGAKLLTKSLKWIETVAQLPQADEDLEDESDDRIVLKSIILHARKFTDDPLWKELNK